MLSPSPSAALSLAGLPGADISSCRGQKLLNSLKFTMLNNTQAAALMLCQRHRSVALAVPFSIPGRASHRPVLLQGVAADAHSVIACANQAECAMGVKSAKRVEHVSSVWHAGYVHGHAHIRRSMQNLLTAYWHTRSGPSSACSSSSVMRCCSSLSFRFFSFTTAANWHRHHPLNWKATLTMS